MSVAKRGASWVARVRRVDGREVQRAFRTKADARRWEVEQRARRDRGDQLDLAAGRRVTLAVYVEAWLARQPWRPSTLQAYRYRLGPVVEALGDRPLGAVLPGEVEDLLRGLGRDAGPATVRNVAATLGKVYRAAIADSLVARSPLQGVTLPRYAPSTSIPTAEDVDALAAACPERYRVLIALGAGAGLRAGEALGLTGDRVRWVRRELVVDRQLVTLVGAGTDFAPPKTPPTRVVPLASPVVEALSRHVEAFGTGEHGLVVVDAFGRGVPRWAFGKMWRRVQVDAGVAVRFHDLRHYCASVLLSGGVPVAQAATMLGHSPAVLLRTYAHVLAGDDDRARQAVEKAFAGDSRGPGDAATHRPRSDA